MKTRIQLRRDISSNWSALNPVLSAGEFGFELNSKKLKIGDGFTKWSDLNYISTIPDGVQIGDTLVWDGNEWQVTSLLDMQQTIDYLSDQIASLTSRLSELETKEFILYE